MRMPRRALRLSRGILDLPHLVEVDERIEIRQVDASKGSPDGETLAFEAGGSGSDGSFTGRSMESAGPGEEARRRKGILDGYCGHGGFLRSLPVDDAPVARPIPVVGH